MDTTYTRRSMCMNVDGFLRNNKFPRGYDIFQNDDGTELKPEEALQNLWETADAQRFDMRGDALAESLSME